MLCCLSFLINRLITIETIEITIFAYLDIKFEYVLHYCTI